MLRTALLTAFALLAATKNAWLEVPYVEQVKAGCGSAAVAMVIQYWATQVPGIAKAAIESERVDQLLPAGPKGIQGSELKKYLEQRGFAAYMFDGDVSDLRHHFEKGRPVIVCLAPRGSRKALHYAVVVGLDNGQIWLNDSARGKLFREDLDRFRKEWDATGDWALLAVPRSAR